MSLEVAERIFQVCGAGALALDANSVANLALTSRTRIFDHEFRAREREA